MCYPETSMLKCLFVCMCVFICAGEPKAASEKKSYWWIIGVVAAVLLVALAGLLAYRKLKGNSKRSKQRLTHNILSDINT